jgi:hypothetical protein
MSIAFTHRYSEAYKKLNPFSSLRVFDHLEKLYLEIAGSSSAASDGGFQQ